MDGHGIIVTIIIGLIAGGLAKMLLPGNNPSGWIITAILGIAGAFVANFLANLLHIGGDNPGLIMSIISSTIGAVVLLAIYHFFQRSQTSV